MRAMMSAAVLAQLTFFFFNDTATTEIYTLSLHDALPISLCERDVSAVRAAQAGVALGVTKLVARTRTVQPLIRSEEHTSELQSRLHLVCRLLLEKKKHSLAAPPVVAEQSPAPPSPDPSRR